MAAQFKEAVVAADLIQMQQGFPDFGDGLFGFALRRLVSLAGQRILTGGRQRSAVELAV
nr:hypothetical protein [Pseudomonas syringae]